MASTCVEGIVRILASIRRDFLPQKRTQDLFDRWQAVACLVVTVGGVVIAACKFS